MVLDTNVLVSGFRSRRGTSHRLLTLLHSGRFVVCVSVPLVLEYEKALLDPRVKIPFSAEAIGKLIDYVCAAADKLRVHFLWRPRLRDAKDEMILELAVAGHCDFIVTFNVKDFKGVEQFAVRAVTPKQFLEILGEEE